LIFAVLDEDPLPQPLQHAPHKQPSVGAQAMSPERSGKRKKISGQQSAKKTNFAKGKNKKSRRRK
jgi:hypothetical protein